MRKVVTVFAALGILGVAVWVYVATRHAPPADTPQPDQQAKLPPVPQDGPARAVRTVVSPLTPPSAHAPSFPRDIPDAIRRVTGAEEETASRYTLRSEALGSLGKNLSGEEIQALLDYLASTADALRPQRTAALKNDIMNVLRSQENVSDLLVPALARIFGDEGQDNTIRDYCIQHLGALLGEKPSLPQADEIRKCLRAAASAPAATYAGTALIALNNDRAAPPEGRAFLRSRAVAFASDPGAMPVIRMTAIQLAGENGFTEVLPALRRQLAEPRGDVPLNLTAIHALARLGDASDLALLADFDGRNSSRRYAAALASAVRIFEERGISVRR